MKKDGKKWNGKMHSCFIYVTNPAAGQMEVKPHAIWKCTKDMKSVECENGENVWVYAEREISELHHNGKTLRLTQRGDEE